jgi:2-polyprenyl-3-methyl-5-hydroxy-6-metoxy-1,4-benzoquinol methylase
MEGSMNQKTYTNQTYWENYYNKTKIDVERIKRVVGAHDVFWERFISSCSYTPKSIIEIGAFPGRYLAYLSTKYDLKPTALDFNSGVGKIESCFESFGIINFECIQADFTKYSSELKYDLVMSIGFIEHFENFDEILDKHYDLLAPGGAMLIMIPNKRYLRKWYSYLVDLQNLKIHNLKSMNLSVFKNFAARNNLKINLLTYHGGFSFAVHQKLNAIQTLIFRMVRNIFRRLNPWIIKNPNKYMSSSIVAIFTKP